MAKHSLGSRDKGWRKHQDQPAGSSLARMCPARLGVTKYRGGSAARHPGWGFGKGRQQREAGERKVKGMAKRIGTTGGIGCKTQVVCVPRTDGVQIRSDSRCLAVGKLLSRGPVNMVGGCEARHFWGCLAATTKEGKSLTETQKMEGGKGEKRAGAADGGEDITLGARRGMISRRCQNPNCSHSDNLASTQLTTYENQLMLLFTANLFQPPALFFQRLQSDPPYTPA